MDIRFDFTKTEYYTGILPEDHMRDHVRSAIAANPGSGWEEFPERAEGVEEEDADAQFVDHVADWFSENVGILNLFPNSVWKNTFELTHEEISSEEVSEG